MQNVHKNSGGIMESNLTTGSVLKKLLLFAVPIFGANLLQAMYGTADLMIVGIFSDSAKFQLFQPAA
jgi:Na+-driven multidrug efflux pump